MKKIKKIYAYYKGDDYICDGTLEELAKRFNVGKRTIIYYATPTHIKRNKNGIRVVKVEG